MVTGKHTHTVTVKITEGISGVLVAQIAEIPGIIVQAETKEKLEAELKKSFDLYLEAFPEEHDKLFHDKPNVEYEQVQMLIA